MYNVKIYLIAEKQACNNDISYQVWQLAISNGTENTNVYATRMHLKLTVLFFFPKTKISLSFKILNLYSRKKIFKSNSDFIFCFNNIRSIWYSETFLEISIIAKITVNMNVNWPSDENFLRLKCISEGTTITTVIYISIITTIFE